MRYVFNQNLEFKKLQNFCLIFLIYINPIEPAVNPTARKNVNSSRSLGREFTNKFN